MSDKTCSKCRLAKPRSAFGRLRSTADGLRHCCKACRRPYTAAWHKQHQLEINERSSQWRAANRERALAGVRRWVQVHRDEKHRGNRLYYQRTKAERQAYEKTPERRAHNRANSCDQRARRRLTIRTTTARITQAEWRTIKAGYLGLCVYCGARPGKTMDHIEPLCRGGTHSTDNVAPACRSCNSAKGAKSLLAFLVARTGAA